MSTPSSSLSGPKHGKPAWFNWQAGLPYALCPILTWFGYANPVIQFPLLVCVLPLSLVFLALRSLSRAQAFRRGWLAGSLTFSACLYWVVVPVHFFGNLPWVLALPCPLLLGIYLGLYPGFFCLAASWAWKKFSWLEFGVFCSMLWILLDWVRGMALTGFPWLSLAQAFSPWPLMIQSTQIIGAFGLSGLIVLCSTWLLLAPRKKSAWLLTGLIMSLHLGFGAWSLGQDSNSGQSSSKVLIVQGNIDQNRKWDQDYQLETLETYLRLTRRGLQGQDCDLILWPETAMPFYLQEATPLAGSIQAFCRQQQIPLLTGAPGYIMLPNGKYHLYNRAYLIDSQGKISSSYAKQHLVPFGEYIPFSRFLPFLDKLVQGVSDFSPGTDPDPLLAGDLALGILICYEIIFEQLVQQRVTNQSNLLINLSNDAWFGRTSAPRQHLHQAILRAVEQNRTLVRATNSGISAVITPKGRLQAQSELFKTQLIKSNAITTDLQRSTYSRSRTFLFLGCLAVFLALFSKGLILGKGQKL